MSFDGAQYKDPAGGSQSTIGNQFNTQYWEKKALVEARKTQFFTQMASSIGMPKHFGKKIIRYHYIPLLDDQNLNDQGIDAAGVTITGTQYFVRLPRASMTIANASKAAAATAIQDNLSGTTCVAGADGSGGTGLATLTVTGSLTIKVATQAKAAAIEALNLGVTVQQGSGNLYGSSKDIGTITGKLPLLSETGGRVNRVGFKRKELEGTFEKFGFFHEWTRDSYDFDSDAELQQHIHRELLAGASELTEDALQVDLLTQAGVVKFAGGAINHQTMDADCLVTYGDLMRLSIDLDNNRTPKSLTAFTGTRMIDTKTISGARAIYCGSELIPTLRAMKDLHNQPAFTPIEKYSAGGTTLIGEQGSLGDFRVIIVPEMTKWAGHGADASADTENYSTNGRYDVFPMLVVGEESFTTISFQTDGQSSKFKIYQRHPGQETADRTDPFGETGFSSIKWHYGFMLLRGERLAVLKTVARM